MRPSTAALQSGKNGMNAHIRLGLAQNEQAWMDFLTFQLLWFDQDSFPRCWGAEMDSSLGSRAVATQAEIGTSYFFYLNPLAVFYHLVISYLVSPSKHLAKANGDKGCFWGDLCVLGTGLQRWEGLLGQFGTQRDPRLWESGESPRLSVGTLGTLGTLASFLYRKAWSLLSDARSDRSRPRTIGRPWYLQLEMTRLLKVKLIVLVQYTVYMNIRIGFAHGFLHSI